MATPNQPTQENSQPESSKMDQANGGLDSPKPVGDVGAAMLAEFQAEAANIDDFGKRVRAAGLAVGGNAPIPKLNPDGSLAEPE